MQHIGSTRMAISHTIWTRAPGKDSKRYQIWSTFILQKAGLPGRWFCWTGV
jgi:hypothetical protein